MVEEGYLKIVGRTKDMIIRRVESIYSGKVEAYLATYQDIEEIHVCGVPGEFFGQQVGAWVKVKPGRKAVDVKPLEEFCKEKIAHFKVPRVLKIVEVSRSRLLGKSRRMKCELST